MDRREFVAAGLSGLLSYTCTCCRNAMASPTIKGCRMVGATDAAFRASIDREPNPYIGVLALPCRALFKVRAGVCTFDDNPANAYATPEQMFEKGHDGTVLIGNHLIGSLGIDNAALVVAHEMGHVFQFKHGMKPGDAWQMEPHADFLAGWVLGRQPADSKLSGPDVDKLAAYTFGLGDTLFNDPAHHGEPQLRATMVRVGFEAGFDAKLSAEAAFEKGLKIAGLT